MRFVVVSVVLASAVFASVAWGTTPMPPSPQQLVDERVEGMKKFGAALKASGQAATTADAKAKLAEAIAFSESIVSRFPKGTGIGDPGVTKSRAKQDIWTQPVEFKASADKMTAILKDVGVALDSGDKTKIDAAFAQVGSGCGGCHKPFRGPEL